MNQDMVYNQMYGSVVNPNQPPYGDTNMPQNNITNSDNQNKEEGASVEIVSDEEAKISPPSVVMPEVKTEVNGGGVIESPKVENNTDNIHLEFLQPYLNKSDVSSISYSNDILVANHFDGSKETVMDKDGEIKALLTNLSSKNKNNSNSYGIFFENYLINVYENNLNIEKLDFNFTMTPTLKSLITNKSNIVITGKNKILRRAFLRFLVGEINESSKIINVTRYYDLKKKYHDYNIIEMYGSSNLLFNALSQNPDWIVIGDFFKDNNLNKNDLLELVLGDIPFITEVCSTSRDLNDYLKILFRPEFANLINNNISVIEVTSIDKIELIQSSNKGSITPVFLEDKKDTNDKEDIEVLDL